MKPLPEYSPTMLGLMLQACQVLAKDDHGLTAQKFARQTATAAGVHVQSVQYALAGRLRKAESRVRLWALLGHFPADAGIVLTDDGGQIHG
ncbi:hypothetical protein [Mesorhizobium japonicum]|nr:hypothetical protein [Mesorhizobium japonicum]